MAHALFTTTVEIAISIAACVVIYLFSKRKAGWQYAVIGAIIRLHVPRLYDSAHRASYRRICDYDRAVAALDDILLIRECEVVLIGRHGGSGNRSADEKATFVREIEMKLRQLREELYRAVQAITQKDTKLFADYFDPRGVADPKIFYTFGIDERGVIVAGRSEDRIDGHSARRRAFLAEHVGKPIRAIKAWHERG